MEEPIRLGLVPVEAGREPISCCSLYRECSDAHKCLNPNYRVCAYRKNLEAGRIFYGKNAIFFSMERYSELCAKVESLDERAQFILDSIICGLREYARGATRFVVRKKDAEVVKPLCLFDVIDFSTSVPYLCSLKALRDRVKASEYYERFRRSERDYKRANEKEESQKASEAFLVQWLNGDGKAFRDIISAPYAIVAVKLDSLQYLEKLYHERVFLAKKPHTYLPSPLLEDGLLTPKQAEAEMEKVKRWGGSEE